MTPLLGRTENFYNLWEMSQPYFIETQFYTEFYQDFNLIQKLSYDIEDARKQIQERYGECSLELNEEVRGKYKSFSKFISKKYRDDVFLFGKYKGNPFNKIHDLSYKVWYWGETKGTEKKSQPLEDYLLEKEVLIPINNSWTTPDKFLKYLRRVSDKLDGIIYPDGHYYEDGERVTLQLKLVKYYTTTTRYGFMYVYIFSDLDETKLIRYNGSLTFPLSEGDIFTMQGIINHDFFFDKIKNVYVDITKLKKPVLIEKSQTNQIP